MSDCCAPHLFLAQSSDGFSLQYGPPAVSPVPDLFFQDAIASFKYSPFGKYLVIQKSDRIQILDGAAPSNLVRELVLPQIMDISFSPKETYLSVLTRYVKPADSSTPPPKNHLIYKLETGEHVYSLTQKALSNWDVKWLEDESKFACQASGEVQFFDPSDQSKGVISRLKVEGLQTFSVSPGKRPVVATFVPEKKGQPAFVRLFDVPNGTATNPPPLASVSFFRADSVSFYWNDIGTNILVLAHTDVDATGQSYYGETSLYYLSISGNFDCRVELNKPGPVHDVTWSPNSREFIVIYGTMPAKATVFDNRASPMFELGSAPRNQVQYNKHGRLFFLGGFGNLAGDVDVWDRKNFRKVASINASNSSFCDWSPDGRYIITGTLWRRMKVDNGIKIWHHSGVLLHDWSVKELYHASWKPEKADTFPERGALSPPPAGLATAPPPKKAVGKYVPPSARNRPASSQPSYDRDALDSNPDLGKKKVGGKSVPGMNKSQNDKKGKQNGQSPSQAPNGNVVGAVPGGVLDTEKKIKNINKKLKQIKDLKEKRDQGVQLELTQIQKIDNEGSLQKELEDCLKQLGL